jgi:hypothetical protein
MSRLVVVMLVCVVLLVTAGSAAGATVDASGAPAAPNNQLADDLFEERVGEPTLDVFLTDRTVAPGTETTVELTIVNTGSIERGSSLDTETATARGVSITVDGEDAPVDVSTGDTGVGSIPPGEAVTVPVTVTAPASADGESGELDVDVEYTYTEVESAADDETESESFGVPITVREGSRFEIEDVDTDAQVGTDGTVEVEIENVGEADADNVRVTARSPTGGVTLGAGNGGVQATGPEGDSDATTQQNGANGPAVDGSDTPPTTGGQRTSTVESGAFLGELEEDDSEDVEFDTRIDPDLSVESYLLELTVVYEDEDGILRESPPLATAVEPTGGQTFEIENVTSTLAVGESGTITADLENTGPEDAESPVVRAEPASERIDIGESRVALDDLDDDESTEVTFEADVSGQADPGPRQVTFTVEYGANGDRLESDPIVRQVEVAGDQPAFTVSTTDGEIPAGTTETVRLNVTNNRAETVSNVNVFLYPDGPLSVDTDEAFIPELEPGESETVAVEVSVDETASQRAYPLEVDLRYDTETDEDLISEVYQVPVTAAEPPPDDGLLPSFVSLAGFAVIVVGTAIVVRWRR